MAVSEDDLKEIERYYEILELPEKFHSMTKITLQCKAHSHVWPNARIWNILKKKNVKCPGCRKLEGKSNNTSPEEFYARMEMYGYRVLTTYLRAAEKVMVQCLTCDNTRSSLPYNIKESCRVCAVNGKKEDVINRLNNRLMETGYALRSELDLSQPLTTQRIKLKCPRPDHDIYTTTVKKYVYQETSCRACQNLARLDISLIRSRLDPGWRVSGDYSNESSVLNFVCPHEEPLEISWNRYQSGQRCHCGKVSLERLSPDKVREHLKNVDLKWVGAESEYVNARSILTVQCFEEHRPFPAKFGSTYADSVYCPNCQKTGMSRYEINLFKKFEEIGIPAIKRHTEFGFEIDLYFPSARFGVEICGLYYHNELTRPWPDVHQEKCKKSVNVGVKLATIYEDEIRDNFTKYFKYILKEVEPHRVPQLKVERCQIESLDREALFDFFRDNHPLGSFERNVTNIRGFGIFYEGSLVFAVAFRLDQDDPNLLILDRFCEHLDFRLENGLAHLLPPVLNLTQKCRYTHNNRFPFQEEILFEKTGDVPFDFDFVKGSKRKTKFQLRLADQSLDLVAERRKQGYLRIFDCGGTSYSIE